MKRINYKSDFDFILRLQSCNGEDVGWPTYDWEATFWTNQKVNAFRVGCKGGCPYNCFNDDDRIHVVMNNHKLGVGVLQMELRVELPNGEYPDDYERIVAPLALEMELIKEAAPCPEEIEVEVLLPYIKGKDAYTSAQEGGYEGSEAQFCADLAAVSDKADRSELSNTLSEPTEAVLEDIEPGLVKEALRTVPQALSEQQRAQVLANLGVNERAPLIALWKEWGKGYADYDPAAASPWILNGLNLSDEEAFEVLQLAPLSRYSGTSYVTLLAEKGNKVRTFMPIYHFNNMYWYSGANLCWRNSYLEVVRFGQAPCYNNVEGMFRNCSRLRAVYGLNFAYFCSNFKDAFNGCSALETLEIGRLQASLDLSPCPKISLYSLEYIVTKAANTTVITITVHRDVYAKLTDEANSEWYAVKELAASKNISFATV